LDQPLLVGRDDDCDLLLLDEQAPSQLLRVVASGDGHASVTPLSGALTDEAGQVLDDTFTVQVGQAFGAEGLWLEVQASDAPWTVWTDPADRQPPAQEDLPAQTALQEAALQASVPDEPMAASGEEDTLEPNFDDWLSTTAEGDPNEDPWAALSAERPHRPQPSAATPGRGVSARLQRWMVLGGGATLTAAGLVAMAVQLGLPAVGEAMAVSPPAAELASRDAEPVAPGAAAPLDSPAPAPPATPTAAGQSPTAGLAATRGPAATPPPAGTGVRVRGGETVLQGATVVTLPFEVREVVMGARSRVVLDGGRVLMAGDAVGAWRLMEIRAGTLVFEGPERVLLPW